MDTMATTGTIVALCSTTVGGPGFADVGYIAGYL